MQNLGGKDTVTQIINAVFAEIAKNLSKLVKILLLDPVLTI
jgi:hypothetical protein